MRLPTTGSAVADATIVSSGLTLAGVLVNAWYNGRRNKRGDAREDEASTLRKFAELRAEAESVRHALRQQLADTLEALARAKIEADAAKAESASARQEAADARVECEKVTEEHKALERSNAELSAAYATIDRRYLVLRVKYRQLLDIIRIRVTDKPLPAFALELLREAEDDIDRDVSELVDRTSDAPPNGNKGG